MHAGGSYGIDTPIISYAALPMLQAMSKIANDCLKPYSSSDFSNERTDTSSHRGDQSFPKQWDLWAGIALIFKPYDSPEGARSLRLLWGIKQGAESL